jgi:hypothetical protein
VLAAGVSLPDLMAREGVHPETLSVPFIRRTVVTADEQVIQGGGVTAPKVAPLIE